MSKKGKFHVSKEWLMSKLENGTIEEPGSCIACGAMAGCCDKYPACPGGVGDIPHSTCNYPDECSKGGCQGRCEA